MKLSDSTSKKTGKRRLEGWHCFLKLQLKFTAQIKCFTSYKEVTHFMEGFQITIAHTFLIVCQHNTCDVPKKDKKVRPP